MIDISLDTPVKELIHAYPEVKEIMVELGFKAITKPGMLSTVGKYMTLRKGSTLRYVELGIIVNKFREHGFNLG